MAETFFEQPILNSPYEVPTRHHDLDEDGQPTDGPPREGWCRSELITPEHSATSITNKNPDGPVASKRSFLQIINHPTRPL